MAHTTQSKTSSARQTRKTVPTVAMMTVKGDPATFFQDFKLPAGTELAIVSKSSELVRTIQRKDATRFGVIREIVAGTATATVSRKSMSAVINEEAFKPDARSQALLEGVRIAQEDLREAGGAYDLKQVRLLMQGVSRQAIDKRIQEGSLLSVPGPSNRRSYPTLQFNRDGTIVAGLKAVRKALPSSNPWIILNFLARPDDRLDGRKPIDVLKAGDVELVVEAARRLGNQGA
jgi:hypothetical protein